MSNVQTKLNSDLERAYPDFFNNGVPSLTPFYSQLLHELAERVCALDSNAFLYDAKSKHGELSISLQNANDEAEQIAEEIEEKSRNRCEICGATANKQKRGWFSFRCREHGDQL